MANENGVTGNPQQAPAIADGYEMPALSFHGYPSPEKYREALQNFNSFINLEPPRESIENTPDNKARTVLISHIEGLLDSLFFGLWQTESFKWSVIANEVVGSL